MRPLSDVTPKALMPVANRPLLDLALDRLAAHGILGTTQVAVNAHHLAHKVSQRVRGRARLSVEQPEALGTAGALGAMRDWLDGRAALVTNADVYQPGDLRDLVEGWDRERCRLLVTDAGDRRADFRMPDGAPVCYLGSCLLPWTAVRGLTPEPTGLYEVLWRGLDEAGRLDLVRFSRSLSIDCGTPGDYLAANLAASGGTSVIGDGSSGPAPQVLGSIQRCVVWDGAWVGPHESLHDVIRAGTRDDPVTVPATVGM